MTCSPAKVITMTDHTPDSPFFPQLEPIAARYWSSIPYVSGWSMLEFCRSTRAGRFHGTPLGGGVWAGLRLMRGELFDPHFFGGALSVRCDEQNLTRDLFFFSSVFHVSANHFLHHQFPSFCSTQVCSTRRCCCACCCLCLCYCCYCPVCCYVCHVL